MKHFFLDTNIVLDLLANRIPYAINSGKIIDLAEKGEAKLYMSSVSYSNIYYILRKTLHHKETISVLKQLEEMIETVDVTKQIVKQSLYSEFKDFEDAVQNYTALSHKKITAIITRNPKDFKKSNLTILSPEEALNL